MTPEYPEYNTQTGDEDGVSISEYLVILLDEWPTTLIPIIIVLIAAAGYLLTAVPSYRASGVIQVSTSDSLGANAMLDLADIGKPSPVETEVEILRSRHIVGKAMGALSLSLVQETPKVTWDLGVSLRGTSPVSTDLQALRSVVKNVQVSDRLEQPISATMIAGKNGSIEVRLNGQTPVTIQVGQKFDQAGVSFDLIKGNSPPEGKQIKIAILPNDLGVERTLESLSVESIGGRKDTSLVRVSANSVDRKTARNLVNAVMDAYMTFALEWRTLRADRSATFIEQQLEQLNSALETSEKDLQLFVEENSAIMLPEQAKELIKSGSQFELEMRKIKIQQDLLTMVAASLNRSVATGKPASLTGDFLFDDELLGKAIGQLNTLEMKRETLRSEVTDSHPQLIKLGDEIARVRAQIRDLVQASRMRIKERRNSIEKETNAISGKLATFPDKERKLAGLTRNLEVSQELFTFLMTKLEESRILKASTTTDKRIIDTATTPFKRSKPKRLVTVVLAGFLGLLLGVGAVFARRSIDPRIRDEEEAKTLAGLPTYGAVPDLKALGLVSGKSDERALDSIWDAPKGPTAESFRTIRTNVEFAQVGEESLRVLQITSSEASEGKSTVIANLAVALSKAGHKVILLDLDLRRPSQHRVWGIPRTPGISDYLVGRTKIPIQKIEKFGVDVICAGNEPPESQRLLSSQGLSELIKKWREEYDYVLLDTPPLLVADSLVISRMSDMVLFVVRPRFCRRAHLKLAQNTARRMDLAKGLIINGLSTRRGGYYHYYRGSYYGSKTSDTQEH